MRHEVQLWEKDKAWADQFMPDVCGILGRHIIGPAPVEEDAERNTDLIVLRMANSRIAVRMRSYERIWKKWPNQITIRTERPTQHKTEYEKIIEGWGQYFFYGFGTEDGLLGPWVLGNLTAFRNWVHRYKTQNAGEDPGQVMQNGDRTFFRAIDFAEIPNFVIAQETMLVRQSPLDHLNHWWKQARVSQRTVFVQEKLLPFLHEDTPF